MVWGILEYLSRPMMQVTIWHHHDCDVGCHHQTHSCEASAEMMLLKMDVVKMEFSYSDSVQDKRTQDGI